MNILSAQVPDLDSIGRRQACAPDENEKDNAITALDCADAGRGGDQRRIGLIVENVRIDDPIALTGADCREKW